jgi:hypothetical protein
MLSPAVSGFIAGGGLGRSSAPGEVAPGDYLTWASHSDDGRQDRFEAFREALRELGLALLQPGSGEKLNAIAWERSNRPLERTGKASRSALVRSARNSFVDRLL